MKKIIALILCIVMACLMSTIAFAETVEAMNTTPSATLQDGDKLGLGIGDLGEEEIKVDPDKPGATYYYTLFMDGEMIKDAEVLKHLDLSIKETGKMVEDYGIVKHNDVYKIKIMTKKFMTIKTEKSTLTITMKKNNHVKVLEAEVKLVQAWAKLDESHVEAANGETYIYIPEVCGEDCGAEGCKGDNCLVPSGISYEYGYTDDHNLGLVVTLNAADKYFEIYIAETPVWFSGKNTHKVTGVLEVTTSKGPKELWIANENAEIIETLSFAGDFGFDYVATQHVKAGKEMFVYAVVDGKYDLGKFEWNAVTECWEAQTVAPIDILVSDVELKGLKAESVKENPGTGAYDFIGIAVAALAISAAAISVIVLTNKKEA